MFAKELYFAGSHSQPAGNYPVSVLSSEQSLLSVRLRIRTSPTVSFLVYQTSDVSALDYISITISVIIMILL